MKVDGRIINYRVGHFLQETGIVIFQDVLIMILIFTGCCWMDIPVIVAVVFSLFDIVINLIFYYKVIIQAIIDKDKLEYTTEILAIKEFNAEKTIACDRDRRSYVRFLFPKDMDVNRYKIRVINQSGEEKKLRTITSKRRISRFVDLKWDYQIECLKVTYLKRSKILIGVELVEELDKKTTRKQRNEIEKTIRAINDLL